MRVHLYAVDQTTGAETLQATYDDLRDCFDLDDETGVLDYTEAADDLMETGRAWVGGGAAALFLLVQA